MKDTLQSIKDRRSCRAYKPDMITKDELDTVLESAFLAPSAKNKQLRHLTVVTNREMLDDLNVKICSKIERNPDEYHVFYHAPVVIFLSAPKGERWAREDMGILIENMTLCAESIGLGTVILGLPQRYYELPEAAEDIKKLGAPEGYEPVLCMSLGYKETEDIPERPRDRSLVSYIK